ncbi:hypothetical protein LINPERPRIM_LOCUS28453 [Linum perenne]
MPRRLAPPP